MDGFFLKKEFDIRGASIFRGVKRNGIILGTVVDNVRRKWIVVEMEHEVRVGDVVKVVTPEDEVFELEVERMEALGREGRLFKVGCGRYVLPRSVVVKMI